MNLKPEAPRLRTLPKRSHETPNSDLSPGDPILDAGSPLGLEAWVNAWLDTHRMKIDAETHSYLVDGESRSKQSLLAQIMIEVRNQDLRFSERDVQNVLFIWQERQEQLAFENLKSEIAFDPSSADAGSEEIARLLEWILPEEKCQDADYRVLCRTVLIHCLWLVKRKVNQLPTEQHIFLVLTGIPRIGKTRLLDLVFKPIRQLVSFQGDFAFLDNWKRRGLLHEKHVIIVDELGKFQKADVEQVKHYITSEFVEFGRHYVNGEISGRNNATLFGTSNHTLQTLISDKGLSSRFFELPISNSLPEFWDKINCVDYLLIFRSINENASSPLRGQVLAQLRKAQQTFCSPDPLETWLEEECLNEGSTQASKLWESYKTWCEIAGYHIGTNNAFYRKLSEFGIKRTRKAGANYYAVSFKGDVV